MVEDLIIFNQYGDMNGYDTSGYPQISGHVSRGWWKPTISLPRIDAEELRVDVNMLSNNGTRFEALQAVCQGRDFFVLPMWV